MLAFFTLKTMSSWLLSKPFSFTVLSHIGRGVNYKGKQANRNGRIRVKRENFSSSSYGWQQIWVFGQIISSTRKTFLLKQG